MSLPVISQPSTPRVIAQGMAFSLALSATNEPTLWTAGGLPPGLAIDPVTGTISGTPTTAGLFTASITAATEEETSAPVQIVFSVQASPPGGGSWQDIELDWDLVGGEVKVPGVESGDGEPVLRLKRGDHFPLLIGLSKWGVLREVNADPSEVSLQIGIKEFEPERLATLSTGAPEKIGDAPDQTRYRIWIRLTPSQWSSILDNYEDDAGTEVLALAEAQLVVGLPPSLYDESLFAPLILHGGMGEAGPYGSPAIEETFAFEDLGAYEVATPFRLTVSLAVEGRPTQSILLIRTFDLIHESGEWVVSALAGPDSGQGTVDGTRWRATLVIDSVEGTAGGLDVDLTLTTSDDATPPNIVAEIPFSTNLNPHPEEDVIEYYPEAQFELRDSNGQTLGSSRWIVSGGIHLNLSDMAGSIVAEWHQHTGLEDVTGFEVLDEGENSSIFVVRFFLDPDSPVHHLWCFPSAVHVYPVVDYVRSGGTPPGESAGAALIARLEQLETNSLHPLSRTSRTFRIGIARDMLPDS